MKNTKIVSLGVLSAIFWIWNWFLLNSLIYQGKTTQLIGLEAVATILALSFLIFFTLVNQNKVWYAVHNALIFFGYLFVMPKDIYVIVGGVIFLVCLWLFEQRIRSEEKSRLDFSIRRSMSGSMSVALYPLLLLIGLNVYYNTQVDLRTNPQVYYDKLAFATTKTVSYVTTNLKSKELQQLSSEQRQQLQDQVTYNSVEQIRQYASSFQPYVPILFALTIMSLLWTFMFILRWITIAVGWLIFRILLSINVFEIGTQTVEIKKLQV